MLKALLIGRWQVKELHEGHIALINAVLNAGFDPIIAIRKTKRSPKNPYSAWRRKRMIKKSFPGFTVIIIPDISEVCVGRNVGYRVLRFSDDIESISGTDIREALKKKC